MGARERKGPVVLPGRCWGIVSSFSRKGRTPLALLLLQLGPRRAGVPVPRNAGAGSRSLPGREELCSAGRPWGPPLVLSARGHQWFSLNDFYMQLKEKMAVNRKRLGARCAKAKPVRVFPKTTHPPALLGGNSGPTSPAASPEIHFPAWVRAGMGDRNTPDSSSFPFNQWLRLLWRNIAPAYGLAPSEHFQSLCFDTPYPTSGDNTVPSEGSLHLCRLLQRGLYRARQGAASFCLFYRC